MAIASSKISFVDQAEDKSNITLSNTLESFGNIYNTAVNKSYELNGSSGSCGFGVFSSKNEIITAANRLAAIKGVVRIEVTRTGHYKNGDFFTFWVETVTSFRYHYAFQTGDTTKFDSRDNEAYAELKRIANLASQCATAFEKEKYVHDYLVANITYGDPDGNGNLDQTAYGALILKKCVCNGYASTFELLLTMLGIECNFVVGQANNGGGFGGHAWNQVRLDGEWYNVDVTWDDPLNNPPGEVTYTYFNVTDNKIANSHVPNNKNWPKCTSLKYNGILMIYKNCATQEEANNYAREQVNAGNNYVEFVYTGAAEFDISSLMYAVGKGVSYYHDTSEVGTVYRITFN